MMGEHLCVHGPLCSCHHVPTLLSFSDRIKQCNSGKSKLGHQAALLSTIWVILKRKPWETPFMAHELQPPQEEKQTQRWQRKRSWQAMWRKKSKKSNILYRLQTYNSILEFPLIKPDLLFPRSLISWKSWIFPKAPLFHLSEVIRTRTIVNIQTLACAIQRPQRETRQIAPGGSWCLLCRGDYHWFTSYNKHSLKNISQIQEDHSSS